MAKELTTTTGTDLDVFRDLANDAGAGLEGARLEELIPPFIMIMHAQSPQLDRTSEQYVPGGQDGMFFDTVKQVFYDGEKEGLDFLPCARAYDYLEWVPRNAGGGGGKGFRGQHGPEDDMVQQLIREQCPGGKVFKPLVTPEGNNLIQTYSLYVLYAPAPITETNAERGIFSFTSTRIKPYRQLFNRIGTISYPVQDNEGRVKRITPPIWAHRWHATTVPQRNDSGRWHTYHFDLAGGPNPVDSLVRPNEPLYALAKEFSELVRTGTVRADYAASEGAASGGAMTDDEVPF